MLKDSILTELEQNRTAPLSGQELADRYQVSRNAVWKAINALKAEGVPILSVKNKGYLLAPEADRLSQTAILQAMDCESSLPVYLFPSIDSTNNEAKRMLASGQEQAALIVSDTQTEGRGRRGKQFYSPEATGIYMSLILPLPEHCPNPSLLTIAAAAAVREAVAALTGIELQIKWVNDLFYNGRKAGGILTEAISDLESGRISHAVIGIGLNLHTKSFPEELQDIATGLPADGIYRNELIAEITRRLLSMNWQEPTGYLELYRRHSFVLGKKVQLNDTVVTAENILDDGALLVRYPNGHTEALKYGEIRLLT